MARSVRWIGWALLAILILGYASTWIDWSHLFAEEEPLEPGPFYSMNPALVTGVVFSAADYKLYAYRWGPDDKFNIVVIRPGHDEIEECEAGEAFLRWFAMTTEIWHGQRLQRPLESGSGDWAVFELVTDTVLEGEETRLRLPSTPGDRIVAEWYGVPGQYPLDWDPDAFGIVKSGCARLGAKP